jgi:1-acyl-sn-glycerol-3-phosphate acyltransferase
LGLLYSASRFLLNGLVRVASSWEVRGLEHIPRTGGLIVASNHISFYDPPLIGIAADRELHYLGKEELFRIPVLGWLIRTFNGIPIRRGVADMSGLSKAMEVLRAGKTLVMFPEGSRMRDGELHPARPGVGMLAVGTDALVLPCFISGSDRPGGWITRRSKLCIRFGPARSWKDLAGSQAGLPPGRALYQGIGDGLMKEIAALRAEQLKSVSRGTA